MTPQQEATMRRNGDNEQSIEYARANPSAVEWLDFNGEIVCRQAPAPMRPCQYTPDGS